MNKTVLHNELLFKAVRSSGAGGQNVNKVSTKIVLSFDLEKSEGLSDEEKELLQQKLVTKLSQDNLLILNCDETRSQLKNKEIAIKRFFDVLTESLKKPKPRKKTKVPKSVKEKRLKDKKKSAEIKTSRKKPKL